MRNLYLYGMMLTLRFVFTPVRIAVLVECLHNANVSMDAIVMQLLILLHWTFV